MDERQSKALSAGSLASSAIISTLIKRLRHVGVLSLEDERELYDSALLLLEEWQGKSAPSSDDFHAARGIIEQHLAALPPRRG